MVRKLGVVSGLLFFVVGASAADVDAAAVAAAAKKSTGFLISQQNDNGTFGKDKAAGMPGMVALVVKSLACSPEKLRENNPAVDKAVKYILSKKLDNGAIAIQQFGLENYNTACSVIALAALENPAYKDVIEKAKNYILSCQALDAEGYKKDEHFLSWGGFGYGSSKRRDLSNTGFSLEALKAAGLEEGSPAWKNAIVFINRCQENSETNDAPEMKGGDDSGGHVYIPGTSEMGTYTAKSGKKMPKPYGNMTYMAVKSLIYAGVKKDDPALAAAFKWIKNNYSVKLQPGAEGTRGYYYYVLAFAKAFTAAGVKELDLADGRKVNWAKDLAAHLISLQKNDGSFVNADGEWMEGDPVLATSYALDALNLCHAALK
jgi:squalene-hopene/tetraprenyl-beta-curcumene cyclase